MFCTPRRASKFVAAGAVTRLSSSRPFRSPRLAYGKPTVYFPQSRKNFRAGLGVAIHGGLGELAGEEDTAQQSTRSGYPDREGEVYKRSRVEDVRNAGESLASGATDP